MRLFIDTEFNGFGGVLLSMALVCEDGRHWYEVLDQPGVPIDPWVKTNVIPHLGKEALDVGAFRASLFSFIRQFDRPIIVADWPSDLVCFYEVMLGSDHTETVMLECSAELVEIDIEGKSETPHNALADAFSIRDAYQAANSELI